MNFVEGIINKDGVFVSGKYQIKLPKEKLEIIKQNKFLEKEITMGIRPEDIYDDQKLFKDFEGSVVKVVVDVAELLGHETNIYTDINGFSICASVDARADIGIGDELELALDMSKVHFFDPKSELRLVFDPNKEI